MKSNKKREIISNEDDDYLIDNDEEIIEYNNNKNVKSNFNKANRSPKSSKNNRTSNWIKEAKAKYQQERNKINLNKSDSRTMNNINRKPKKIVNYDDIPVGGGMGGGGDFNIEIKVAPKKNNYMQNNSFNDNNSNIQFRKENNLRQNLENRTELNKPKRNNNYLEEKNDNNINNNNNFEPVEMERKNSMASMITQTCDREMLGRSEFVGIPMNQNNNEINYSNKIDRLSNNKQQNYSLYEKQENFSKISTNNFDNSNFTNKISDFNNTQNIREKAETAIQLQNVQRELDNEIEMNKRLQGQIENYKSEFNNLREELVKKSDIINELQQKISKLEKELFLQGNQLIEAEAKPSQEHYEDIVNNYEEMKKNFDKAIERIKYLTDENEELKETIMRYEGNNKKIKRENKYNKNEKKSKNKKYVEKIDVKDENEEEENPNENENIYREQENNPRKNKMNKNIPEEKEINYNEKQNNEEEIIEENKPEKISIIPEDNDIFGTKKYDNQNKNIRKPRKIQEDGIPVIKRVEEKDNVKDIMVNNYAANDDIYYNRPPIGKPKVKRIQRNNDLDNNLNNFQEQNSNSRINQEYMKNKNDYNNNENIDEEMKNNDKIENINDNDNIQKKTFSSKRKNNIITIVGVFPSQLNAIANEREILNLESQLFNLQKERDLINDEYLKYPEYPKKREEINSKRKVEMKLEEMNKEISLQKLKIRELKNKK